MYTKYSQCDVCNSSVKLIDYQLNHGEFCTKKMISCVFCSSNIEREKIFHHLCTCSVLDERLMKKYNSKFDQKMAEPLIESLIIMKIKHQTTSIQVRHPPYRIAEIAERINDDNFTKRLFYCTKQFNFNILPTDPFYYQATQKCFDLFPLILLPDIKYILGNHLTEPVLTTLNDMKKITSWAYDKVDYGSFAKSEITANDVYFEFIFGKSDAKKYFNVLTTILHKNMNIYMCRIITEYLIDKNTLL